MTLLIFSLFEITRLLTATVCALTDFHDCKIIVIFESWL